MGFVARDPEVEPDESCRWARSPYALWRRVMTDVVLADSRTGDDPFLLAEGAPLWAALGEPTTAGELEKLMEAGRPLSTPSALGDLLRDLCQRGVVDCSER